MQPRRMRSQRSQKPRQKGKGTKVKVWMWCLGTAHGHGHNPTLDSGLQGPGVVTPNLPLRGGSDGNEGKGQRAGSPSSQRPSRSPHKVTGGWQSPRARVMSPAVSVSLGASLAPNPQGSAQPSSSRSRCWDHPAAPSHLQLSQP